MRSIAILMSGLESVGKRRSRSRSAPLGKAAAADKEYGIDFFERSVDREGVFTVKYGLRAPLFGSASAKHLPLWVADMDLPCAPEICTAIQRRADHPTFGYTYQPGEIWEAVRSWLQREHDLEVSQDAFVFSPSVVTAAVAALWAFSSVGDTVILMTPLYEPLQKLVVGAKRELREHALELGADGKYRFDAARLEEDLKGCRVLLFCNPHNPGGRAWEQDELRTVARLCKQAGVLIISDEIWADWCLFEHRHRPLALEAKSQELVTLMAPTKTWNLAGLHCSFLIIEDASLREKYLAEVAYAFLHYGSTFATEAMLASYKFGRPWLLGAKRYIEAQLLHCEEFLRKRCAPEVVPLRPEATYLLWLDCRALPAEDPARFFRETAGVILSSGIEFGGLPTARFARLNVATSRDTLVEALERMAGAVERCRKSLESAADSV